MINKKSLVKICLLWLGMSLLLFPPNFLLAMDEVSNEVDAATVRIYEIKQGKTLYFFTDGLRLEIPAQELDRDLKVEVIKLAEKMPDPWQLDRLSAVYQIEFSPKLSVPAKVFVNYDPDRDSNDFKQIMFYDKNFNSWRPLSSREVSGKNIISADFNLNFARIAVFAYPGVLINGQASWYKYKNGMYTASPDFPKGSRLRVYNTANNKYVDVTVNDYGPERDKHPNRAVDLDYRAFAKIASPRAGIINVRVVPLEIKADSSGQVLGVDKNGAAVIPEIKSPSIIIMRQSDGEILYQKNAETVRPLASLTKIVAVKVFLDQGNNRERLNEVVAYRLQDEKYNYQYCSPSESAKIKMKDGDTLTIKDLIYSSLVGSANNAVESLVRLSGLSRSEFIAAMNSQVRLWGATQTSFVEPTGLSPENVSTALDYAMITKAVMADPILVAASTANRYTFKNANDGAEHALKNTNQLVALNKYNFSASKTGYLDEARYCLMTRLKLGNDQLIVVTLGTPDRASSFKEMADLLRYALRLNTILL